MHKVGKEILIVDSLQRLRPVAMILPVLAERMPFDSRLFVLLGLAPSNQPITELGPLSTNQIPGLLENLV